jgi:uncharacterized Zn-binding protein involved in type VI secretion
MHNHSDQAVARLGDKTSHGGEIITATATIKVHGIAVALEGDMTHCPKCKGNFAILPSGEGKKNLGRWVAYAGTQTECGAELVATFS